MSKSTRITFLDVHASRHLSPYLAQSDVCVCVCKFAYLTLNPLPPSLPSHYLHFDSGYDDSFRKHRGLARQGGGEGKKDMGKDKI